MKMTEHDRLVLVQSGRVLLWFLLLGWALHYNFWLGGAFTAYATFYNKIGLYAPDSPKTFGRDI
jgi:hypothetical protein